MTKEFATAVYYMLHGNPIEYPDVPNVENLFTQGKPCCKCYEEMYHAHMQLLDHLGVDEDPDIECIINAFMDMELMIAEKMFFYGAHFGQEEDYRHKNSQLFDCTLHD